MALFCFLMGLICVIIVGSVKVSYKNDSVSGMSSSSYENRQEAIQDITEILLGLGALPAVFCFVFCFCGVALYIKRKRLRAYILPGDNEAFVHPEEDDFYEDEEEEL